MSESSESSPKMKTGLTLLICVALIVASVVVLYIINSTEPHAERETAMLRRAMLVEVLEAEKGDYRPIIAETGTVAPSREVQLAPQVGGRIISLHSDFNPGGFIRTGEVVLKIETADYENLLAQRESELIEAETELAVEMGRQKVAKRDLELLGERIPEGEDSLVLREPQLAAAKTRVDAAKIALKQAKLNLERTELRSPFDAQILSRMADLGSQISQSMPVAQIVGIEQYWVMATVSPAKLPYIDFPKGDAVGSRVELIKRGGSSEKRVGRLFRLVGQLEANTRLARVVIQVDDPLSLKEASADLPPLLVGEFLEVHIEGKELKDVVRLPINCLRKNDTAWIMSADDKLEVRTLGIVLKDSKFAYVKTGISSGERIITSNLSRVTKGADLRIEENNPDSAE